MGERDHRGQQLGTQRGLVLLGQRRDILRGSATAVCEPATHLLPPEPGNVFEVDATRETHGAVGRAVEDEREQMRQKAGLGGELAELLLRLFSGCGLQRRTEQRGDVRHGHWATCVDTFVTCHNRACKRRLRWYSCHDFLVAQPPMPSCRLIDWVKRPRRKPPNDHSTAAGILAVFKAFSPSQLSQESSAIYRNTSDAAQAFLPPIQAVADTIPGVGSIIRGVIGGTLSVLQLVDVIRPLPSITPDLNLAHRDTSRTRTTWRSSPFDCTCFATTSTARPSLRRPLKRL
jgi:hypothetical protein